MKQEMSHTDGSVMRESTITIDTREQRPYEFPSIRTRRAALPSGDYSLEGIENQLAIERKSLADLVNTLLRGRRRFRAELRRLQEYEYAAVIVEASLVDILAGNYRSDITPESLVGIIVDLMTTYPRIHWLFCSDRPAARLLCQKLLLEGGEKFGCSGA